MDRSNRLRDLLETNSVALGAEAKTHSPASIELFDELGLDFVWIDLEHAGPSPLDAPAVEALARAATDIEPLVRLPTGEPYVVRKILDAGIRTILIPRVESPEAVRRAVRAAYYAYDDAVGDRGIGSARVGGWGADMDDHVDREDNAVLVGIMIENRTAVDAIEDLLAVPELGFVFIGPADLSVSLDRPMEKDAPSVRDHIERVERAAREAEVPMGKIATEPTAVESAIDDGYRIVRIGTDLDAARAVLTDRLRALR